MNSLEWRVKKLEDKISGHAGDVAQAELLLGQADIHGSIFNQLNTVAKHYKSFSGPQFDRFFELYDSYSGLLESSDDGDDKAKAELILAYEEEIVKYANDIKLMATKADEVLNIEKWPDLTNFQDRLDKLEKITKEQHIQSSKLDKSTEELIEIYNNIIESLKSNMAIWDQRLEAADLAEKE